MNLLRLQATISGILFGCWPLMMNRSELKGQMASLMFAGICSLVVLPFALHDLGRTSTAHANWWLAIGAGLVGGIALVIFGGVLSHATKEQMGTLFVLCLVAQMVAPAIFEVFIARTMSPVKAIGFIAAAVAAYCLTIES